MLESRSITFIIGTLFSALAVSAVAAYFSIVGLMAIFSALPVAILSMGVVLEIAKLVTASWIYQYWQRTSVLMRTYMVTSVVVLSIITSIGIFGFLSKAHLDQAAVSGDAQAKVQRIEQLIERENGKISAGEERIVRIQSGGTLDISESIRQQEEIRDTAWERIQGDITYAEEQIDKIRASLDTDLALKQQELDGLDAIVASYTTQGTTGNAFSRTDNVAKGLEVRDGQKVERDSIDVKMKELRDYAEQQIAGYRNQISQYRADTQATIDNANAEINRLRDTETNAQTGRDVQIDTLQGQIDAVYITIEDYNETLFEKKAIVRELDNEVGPVKYIAQLLYGTSGTAAVDSAVQFVIMLLIFVFDPLAIILIIAANLSLKERRGDRIVAVASVPDMVMDVVEEEVIKPADKPDEGTWASKTTAPQPDFSLEDKVSVSEDLHIDIELPPDGTLTPEMIETMEEPKELPVLEESWVSAKYGDESAMDPKKEVDLQWLIDKKRKDNA